jgi:hypothetical protein
LLGDSQSLTVPGVQNSLPSPWLCWRSPFPSSQREVEGNRFAIATSSESKMALRCIDKSLFRRPVQVIKKRMSRKPKVLKPDETYTFSKYFELPFDIADILADLDCKTDRALLNLPHYPGDLEQLPDLHEQIQDGIRYVGITSEQARREFLIAPIIRYVCRQTQQRVRVEYPVAVNDWLKGTFDYYFQANNLLIIEAKRENLDNGFTQLATELIALDQWAETENPIFYGAVTTGESWRFGIFYRNDREIIEDLKLYRVPEELETLLRIVIGILVGGEQ